MCRDTGQVPKLFQESNILPSVFSGTTCFPLQRMELLDCGVFKHLLAWWDIKDTTIQCGTHSFLHMDIILYQGAMTEQLGKNIMSQDRTEWFLVGNYKLQPNFIFTSVIISFLRMSAFVGNLKTNLGQKYFCVCNHIYTKSPCLPLPQVDAKPCLLQPL